MNVFRSVYFSPAKKKIFPYLNGSYVIRVTTPNQTKLKLSDAC